MAGRATYRQGEANAQVSNTQAQANFSSDTVLNDTLVAIIASFTTSADATFPTTISDAAGNVYQLAYTSPDQSTATPPLPALAVYIAFDIQNFGSGNSVTAPIEMVPSDTLWNSVAIYDFMIAGAALVFDAASVNTFPNGGGILGPVNQLGSDDLVFGLVTDTSNAATTEMSYTTNNPVDYGVGVPEWIYTAWQEASVNLGTSLVRSNITYAGAGTVAAFLMTFKIQQNVTGPGSGGTFIRVNKAPKYHPPIESRAVATVSIDCSQLPVRQLPINYPELSTNDTGKFQGFTLYEFDLEHVSNQGSGLSEVRFIQAYARPQFQNGEDFPSENIVFPLWLTNTTTLETYIIGLTAGGGSNTAFEHETFPAMANKGALRYRAIVPQNAFDAPQGKFTILFFNYDRMGAFTEVNSLASD